MLRMISGEFNSIRTRRAVGYVFTGNSFTLNPVPQPEHALLCHTADGSQYSSTVVFWIQGEDTPSPHGEVYPGSLAGTRLIGLPKNNFEFSLPEAMKTVFKTGQCPKDIDVIHEDFSAGTSFLAGGPGEFDRSVSLTYGCYNSGVFYMQLQMTVPGVKESVKEPLTCEVWTPQGHAL